MNEVVIFGTGEIAVLADFYLARFVPTGSRLYRRRCLHEAAHLPRQASGEFRGVGRQLPPDTYDLFVAVSYGKLNGTRTAKASAARAMGYHLVSYVSSRATVFPDLTHGDNCFILENNVIQPYVKIGNNVTLWSGNHIGHHSTIKDNVFMASHVVVSGGVTVGEASFVGVNVTLRDHVSIGDHCVLGAGALVLENLPRAVC